MDENRTYLELLPHQHPFRFVSRILLYVPGHKIISQYEPSMFRNDYGGCPYVPEACLMEGVAQTAIIYTQLETAPLEEHEIPMLGSLDAQLECYSAWDEIVTYEIRPLRISTKQAMLTGQIYGDFQRRIGFVSVSVAVKGWNNQ